MSLHNSHPKSTEASPEADSSKLADRDKDLKIHSPMELLSSKNLVIRRVLEVSFMAFNFTTAMLIIFVNKRLLLPKAKGGHGFEKFASTLTCWHYIFTTCILTIAGYTGFLVPKHFSHDQTRLRWCLIFIIAVSPLASNFSLLFNTVATYQLWKIVQTPVRYPRCLPSMFPPLSSCWHLLYASPFSLTPQQVVAIMERFYEGRRLSPPRIAALTGILGGITLAEVSNVEFSLSGVATAILAILAAAAYKVMTAKLVKTGWHPLQLMHNIFPPAMLLILSFTAATENKALYTAITESELSFGIPAILEFILSGFLAFLVIWTQYLVVGTTSALTHSLLAQGKTACAIIGGAFFFGQNFQAKQVLGACIAMGSFIAYSLLSVAPPPPSPPPAVSTQPQSPRTALV